MAEITAFTIYFNPVDYPNQYVVRKFFVNSDSFMPIPKEPVYIGNSLNEARKSIPAGLFMLPRNEQDEKQIIESWI